MLATLLGLALATVPTQGTTPAAAGELKLANARVTYGELGPDRPTKAVAQGDVLFLTFEIEGVKVEADGAVNYSIAMEVTDKDGKSIFRQAPVARNDFLPLGGKVLPARGFVSIGLDQAPGTYTCLVTVTDTTTKAVGTLKQAFEVLPAGFGIVQLYMAADEKGLIPSAYVGQVGQSVWLHFVVFGFSRDPAKKQPDISVEMTVLDKEGQPTLAKPMLYEINGNVEENFKTVPLRVLLPLNRKGEFSVRLKASDKLNGKTQTQSLKLVVLTPP